MKNFKVAKIRRTSTAVPTSSYCVKDTGSKIKDWLSRKAFDQLRKWGYLQYYFENVVVETFDYNEYKRKLLTEKVLSAIQTYRYDYRKLDSKDYAVIMGESTFFEYVRENKDNSPFFADTTSFMTDDIYYNDPYRGKRIMNFQVHVVPAMEGFAIVPKAIIEKRV